MIPIRQLLFILILILPGYIIAQDIPDDDVNAGDSCHARFSKAYVKSYFTDSWKVLASPAGWKGRQWLTAGLVSGAAALLYTQDDAIRELFHRNRTEGLDKTSKYFFEPLGSWRVTVPIAAVFYAYGALAQKERPVRTGLTGLKAMAVTAVFTYAIKYAAQRHRPYDDIPPDPRAWEGPFGSYESTSFPSGHASVSWALATVIASEYSDRIWVPVISYSMATLASLSRVYDNDHWASDVFFGAALGFFIGKFVYKSASWCPDLLILPGTSVNGYQGFTMAYYLR